MDGMKLHYECPKCGIETLPEVWAKYDCRRFLVEVELECPECRTRVYAYLGMIDFSEERMP